ncbi:MAG: [Oscillospiraceae bacterium]|nr:[FeFe] hydrogenase H-cluster maturation GTPase HydF [Oscillospiraceae bacterium]MBR7085452.1 [FeFe] hydrogenase H-cluster maturation GTPase HydF [Oscillospiraceae bacterium]
MSTNLNSVPSGERIQIAFFGKRNAGKSSVVNAVTNQQLSVVSEVKGTTTDPVYKAMELLPLGAVMIVDTAGLDDSGELGQLRVEKSLQVLEKTDIAVLVIDSTQGKSALDEQLIAEFQKRKLPYIIAYNKADLHKIQLHSTSEICISAKTGEQIQELKELIAKQVCPPANPKPLIADLIQKNDIFILVIPIDESAPKGRLILPQQQVIRAALEIGAVPVCCQPEELPEVLKKISPRMVITDSQAFGKVSKIVPQDIPLTSFSILFARYKGDLELVVKGAAALDSLKDGDTVLISEGCTHHRQCNDIGTVKLPSWIQQHANCQLHFVWTSGTEFPKDLKNYALIVHCGACMLPPKAVQFRQVTASEQNIPITNYGTAIAHCHGILKRSLSLFPEISRILK